MKNILTFFLLLSLYNTAYAVNTLSANEVNIATFLAMDAHQIIKANGKKLNAIERFGYKKAQKIVRKAQKAGLLDKIAESEGGDRGGKNRRGLLATIFGGIGLLLIWLPIIGLGFGIAGLVIGILGVVKDGANALNLVGLILGGIVTLVWLL